MTTITTTSHQSTDREITLHVHPTRYGNNNVTEAFQKNEAGFELEIRNHNSILRNILTLEEVLDLKEQLERSIDVYWEFMNRDNK